MLKLQYGESRNDSETVSNFYVVYDQIKVTKSCLFMTERHYSLDALFKDMRDGIREEALEKDCKQTVFIKVVHMTL